MQTCVTCAERCLLWSPSLWSDMWRNLWVNAKWGTAGGTVTAECWRRQGSPITSQDWVLKHTHTHIHLERPELLQNNAQNQDHASLVSSSNCLAPSLFDTNAKFILALLALTLTFYFFRQNLATSINKSLYKYIFGRNSSKYTVYM